MTRAEGVDTLRGLAAGLTSDLAGTRRLLKRIERNHEPELQMHLRGVALEVGLLAVIGEANQ